MASQELILKTMMAMLTAFPSRSFSDPEIAVLRGVWLDVLSDVPDDALKVAATEYLRSNAQFAPAPGQLRTRAVELLGADAGAVAERAWQKIIDHVTLREPINDPLAIIAITRAGGLEAFGQSEIDEQHWWHERFVAAYSESFGRQTAGLALPAGNDPAAQLVAQVAATLRACGKEGPARRIEAGQ